MIQQGLLWYDGYPTRTLVDKIQRAALHYQQKYGHSPNVCYVNPVQLAPIDPAEVEGIKVLPTKTVPPNHFWLGIA